MLRFALAVLGSFVLPQLVFAEGLIVLVRHAEKVDDSADAALSEEGQERALDLALLLSEADIDSVLSTDLERTRATAAPLADLLDLPIEFYDPAKLAELAVELFASNRRVLVVGHSNTTPELVRLLGGDPGPPIDEDEYDRLYLIAIVGGQAVTTLLRY